jgi:nitrate reductase assembly molybdenum cofactor insertion protein NarJ
MEIYKYIADLFRYPTVESIDQVQQVSEILRQRDVLFTAKFLPFEEFYAEKTITELEEYYIRTFDVQATCHLDIGYIIFGDDSKRGRFLYHVKEEQEKIDNDCGTDLADFLPNILTLLSKTTDEVLVEELSVSIMLPALKQIEKKLEKDNNIYKIPVQILISLLEEDFSNSEFEAAKIGVGDKPNFLSNYVTGIDKSLFERKQFKRKM